jgi:hypothetical protein
MIEDAVAFARKVWPLGFTKREIEEALGHPVSIQGLRRLKAIENTKVKRGRGKKRDTVWRYKPYQLDLPLEEKTDAG